MTIIKKWTAAVATVMIVFLSSCQKNDPVNSEPLPDPVYMYSYTQDYTVKTADWQVGKDDPSGQYLYCEFEEKNLTQEIYDYGTMQAYLRMNGDNITPLPYDEFWNDAEYGMWTEQATCEFQPGYVTFILKYDDHTTNDLPPLPFYHDKYVFRVRFTWPSYY